MYKLIDRDTENEVPLRKKNYWADNRYYSNLEVTIYGQQFDY